MVLEEKGVVRHVLKTLGVDALFGVLEEGLNQSHTFHELETVVGVNVIDIHVCEELLSHLVNGLRGVLNEIFPARLIAPVHWVVRTHYNTENHTLFLVLDLELKWLLLAKGKEINLYGWVVHKGYHHHSSVLTFNCSPIARDAVYILHLKTFL